MHCRKSAYMINKSNSSNIKIMNKRKHFGSYMDTVGEMTRQARQQRSLSQPGYINKIFLLAHENIPELLLHIYLSMSVLLIHLYYVGLY